MMAMQAGMISLYSISISRTVFRDSVFGWVINSSMNRLKQTDCRPAKSTVRRHLAERFVDWHCGREMKSGSRVFPMAARPRHWTISRLLLRNKAYLESEIGRILHLKSEIRNRRLDWRPHAACRSILEFRISDLRCRIRPISNFTFPELLDKAAGISDVHPHTTFALPHAASPHEPHG